MPKISVVCLTCNMQLIFFPIRLYILSCNYTTDAYIFFHVIVFMNIPNEHSI